MAKKMLIDATHAEETRVVVVDGNKVEEFDFETVNKRQLDRKYLSRRKSPGSKPSLQAVLRRLRRQPSRSFWLLRKFIPIIIRSRSLTVRR